MRICIIQPVMKRYRLPFFIQLKKELDQKGVDLEVVYGTPWPEEAERGDHGDLEVPLGRRVRSIRLFGKLLVLPTLMSWLRADLIVIEHANKHALNYLLMALHILGLKRIAFWGHGRDRQAVSGTLGERWKRRTLHWADWWFAYTKGSADYVELQGYDSNRITIVDNALDTSELRRQLADITPAELGDARSRLGWGEENLIGIYCGSLYRNKRLDILFESTQLIRERNPNFRLLIIGGGALEGAVREFASDREWVQYVGPLFDRQKAIMLKLGDIWLNPGLVGLGVVDAFCAGLPVITTDLKIHSPEIEYLENGFNGLIVEESTDCYAKAIDSLLNNANFRLKMREGALVSADRYSIESMAGNFARGVEECLRVS
ncbi:glycosyltransferase family 4 protein [Cupriavidus basilensis]|uniref:glycosyltransferase family 4 protein n=1 Tax=Cupriavidus basilensis TaxID=68895 RepID=UPI0009E39CF8|nr:glycosyltransferase family 4 protein [Cupriavidus basilensis]